MPSPTRTAQGSGQSSGRAQNGSFQRQFSSESITMKYSSEVVSKKVERMEVTMNGDSHVEGKKDSPACSSRLTPTQTQSSTASSSNDEGQNQEDQSQEDAAFQRKEAYMMCFNFVLFLCFSAWFHLGFMFLLTTSAEYFFATHITRTFIYTPFDSSHNAFLDIRRVSDFWEWSEQVMVPGLFSNDEKQAWPDGTGPHSMVNPTPYSTQDLVHQNHILAVDGIQLRQVRQETRSCPAVKQLGGWQQGVDGTCVDNVKGRPWVGKPAIESEEERSPFGYNRPQDQQFVWWSAEDLGENPKPMPSFHTVSRAFYSGSGYVALMKPFFSTENITYQEGWASNVTKIPTGVNIDDASHWCVRTTANGEWIKQVCDEPSSGNHGQVVQMARRWLQELKEGHWIDWQTRVIIITIQLRGPNAGVRMWIRLSLELTASGNVLPSFQMHPMQDRQDTIDRIYICIWVIAVYVGWMSLREILELFGSGWKFGNFFPTYFHNAWNVLDNINMILFVASLYYLCEAFDLYPEGWIKETEPSLLASNFGFQNWVLGILSLDEAKFYLGINACLLILKMPKFLHVFVPRTALLAKVLETAKVDLIYFSLIFFLVMVGFTDFFFFYFSAKSAMFVSYSLSFFTLFRALFGDFDVDEIDYYSPTLFVPYIFLGYLFASVFLLLSFFFAILGEAQSQVLVGTSSISDTNEYREVIKGCLLAPFHAMFDKVNSVRTNILHIKNEPQEEVKGEEMTTGKMWQKITSDITQLTQATNVILEHVEQMGTQVELLQDEVDDIQVRTGGRPRPPRVKKKELSLEKKDLERLAGKSRRKGSDGSVSRRDSRRRVRKDNESGSGEEKATSPPRLPSWKRRGIEERKDKESGSGERSPKRGVLALPLSRQGSKPNLTPLVV